MLTQLQKDQLTQLMSYCPIPKLKKVLDEGLPRFISGEIEPIQNTTGLIINKYNKYEASDNRCCLIGAALIGKSGSFSSDELFKVSEYDRDLIVLCFDEKISMKDFYSEKENHRTVWLCFFLRKK